MARSLLSYVLTFAVGWPVLGGALFLTRPDRTDPDALPGDSFGVLGTGVMMSVIVGIPSLVIIALLSGKRRDARLRPLASGLLLAPVLIVLAGGGGLGVLALIAIQLLFATVVMPRGRPTPRPPSNG
ncbi:hypothetical protein ACWCYY_07880 [Kitasatospora sp. NPDC001664]